VQSTFECKSRIWHGVFRNDGQELAIRERQLEFYSIDGAHRGSVEINAKSTSTERSAAIGYSLDGKTVYVMDQKQVFLIDAENLEKTAVIKFDPGLQGESDPGRFRAPRHLPGSVDLLLAPREGDLFRWTIGPGSVQRIGKLPATREKPLLEAWPVFGNTGLVIERMNWRTLNLRQVSNGESIKTSSQYPDVQLGLDLAVGYIDETHFIDNSGGNEQMRGPLALTVSESGLQPVAIFDVPGSTRKWLLVSGDGSILVSYQSFEEDLVFETSEAVSD